MKYGLLLVTAIGLGACAGPDNALTVKQFYLRDQEDATNDEPFIRGEKSRILYGAVSMEERKDRLGQYYTVLWSDEAGAGSGPAEVVFEFQQGASGSLIKKRTASFSPDTRSGKAAFSVIGDDYLKGGKVLSWKISLVRDGRVIGSKQSYLWR